MFYTAYHSKYSRTTGSWNGAVLSLFIYLFFIFLLISRITLRVRNLLLLIPTDPEVQDALDNFVPKESSVWSHQVRQTALTECRFALLIYCLMRTPFVPLSCRRHCSRAQALVLLLRPPSSSTSPVLHPSWSRSSDPRLQACPPSECYTI